MKHDSHPRTGNFINRRSGVVVAATAVAIALTACSSATGEAVPTQTTHESTRTQVSHSPNAYVNVACDSEVGSISPTDIEKMLANPNLPESITWLTANGYSGVAARGITTVLIHESGLDPTVNSRDAHGIAAWGSHSSWLSMGNYAAKQHRQVLDLTTQLGFLDAALIEGGVKDILKSDVTSADAAITVERNFIRPANLCVGAMNTISNVLDSNE